MSEKRQRGSRQHPRASQLTDDRESGGSGTDRSSHTDEFWDGWLSVGDGNAVGTAGTSGEPPPDVGRAGEARQSASGDEAAPRKPGAETMETKTEMNSLRLISLVDALDGSRIAGEVRACVERPDEVIRAEVSAPPDPSVTLEPEEGGSATSEESEALGAA